MQGTEYDIPQWVVGYKDDIWRWCQTVQDSNLPEQIDWCAEGSLFPINETSGLGPTALALKLFHMLDLFEYSVPGLRDRMVERINSFQNPKNGYYEDHTVLKSIEKRKWFYKKKNFPVRRAETRQAITALKSVGACSSGPFHFTPKSEIEIQRYFQSLPWDKNPWGAGSHASALLVFYAANNEWFKITKEQAALEGVVFEQLNERFNEETGSWHVGPQSPHQVINAAMKVYTGYDYIGHPPPKPERTIDFCLSSETLQEACSVVDLAYVLNIASSSTDYRRAEINKFVFDKISDIKSYQHPDGGLSYSHNGTQTTYYGMTVSEGMPGIGDLHGTKLFSWALCLIAQILGWDKELGWSLPAV